MIVVDTGVLYALADADGLVPGASCQHPADRRAEFFRLVDGELRPVSATRDGLHCEVLDIWLTTVGGPLQITWVGGSSAI